MEIPRATRGRKCVNALTAILLANSQSFDSEANPQALSGRQIMFVYHCFWGLDCSSVALAAEAKAEQKNNIMTRLQFDSCSRPFRSCIRREYSRVVGSTLWQFLIRGKKKTLSQFLP